MKILVAGGAGFIGGHLCGTLMDKGHQIVCVDDFSLGVEKNIRQFRDRAGFTFYRQDICGIEAVSEIFEREQPEYVMHLAANSDIQASAENPSVEYRNTYTTTYSLLENMRRYGVKRLFFASTSAVYGDKPGVALDEDTPNLMPVSYYGAAKLGSEALISAYSHMNGLRSLVFRFPNVIGPGLTHGVVYDFARKLRRDPSRLEILGDGNQTKPYLYVSDLIDGMIRLMDAPEGVSLYNIGVEDATSVRTIADIVCEAMGLNHVRYEFTGGVGGWKGDVPRFSYSMDKIYATGWRARYGSDEAVRMAVREI